MVNINRLENAEWLEEFNANTWTDYTSNLCDPLRSDEEIEKFWAMCSELYHLSLFPHESELTKREDVPEIYDILDRLAKRADWFNVELLIWKYSEETMELSKQVTEERRKEFEKEWITFITIRDPYMFTYIVWFFWGSTWRAGQYAIRELKNKFPEKFKELKHK